MKFSMKRLAAFVLALVMVLGLFPVMNNAVNAIDVTGLGDSAIGVSYTLANNPSPAAGVTAPTSNSLTIVGGGKLVGSNYMISANTVTITNNKTSKATLSFDYTLSGTFGTVAIDGTSYSVATSSSFEKELESGESITIKVTPKRTVKATGGNDLTMTMTNIALVIANAGPITTTFEAPANGSYTVAYGGESLTVAAGTVSQSATNLASVQYTLTADAGEGYKFVGWYDVTNAKYLSTESTYVGFFESTSTVKAVVVPEDNGVFMTGGMYYDNLNEAVAYAQANSLTQITLVQSGILTAGTYTIPAGITLLIPKDTDYSATLTNDPDFFVNPEYGTEVATPYAFMTLTMAEGAELIVNGTLDIESKHTTLQGSSAARPYGGRICGPYGAVSMSPNSSIVVNNGAYLFAFGYVYGDGTVTANSGAKVYEIMQVTDFPGGSNMAGFVDSDPTYDLSTEDWPADTNPTNDYIKTFPFSQYYVQNIEVALTLNAGASEYVYLSMTAANMSKGLAVEFVGQGGMFNPGENGYIVKDYDPSTDRLNVSVYGDASMAGIALDMTGTSFEEAMQEFLGISKVDSATFILTLNSNISINIVSGTTTVKQDLSLLPGVEITVGEEATLVIAQRSYADDEYDNLTVYGSGGYNIYVWDAENWGNFVFSNVPMVALSYSPTTGRYVRVKADLKDVKLDINGTIVCEGYIYSTVTFDEEAWLPLSGGAQVISSGKTGKLVLQNGAGWEDLAYCLDGTSSCDSAMFIDSVWLQNGDGSFVLTEGAESGTTYNYCDVHDLWYTEGHDNCVVVNTVEITWIVNGEGAPEEYLLGATPSYKGSTPTKPANGCTVYTFAGWATTADGEVLTSLPTVSGEATYFAIFTESVSHVGDTDNDHNCNGCGEPLTNCVDDNADHVCDYAGCQATMSSCADENADHYCDYTGCQATMSRCADNNEDHYCDYSGCQAVLSSCVDMDENHYCDYAGCNEEMSSCEDNDEDHLCDYTDCQAVLSSCVDEDADHLCDWAGCHEILSDCDDADEDHYCDYAGCGSELSECYDADDHFCDYSGCGKRLSNCTPGTPVEDILREPDCEAGEKKIIINCSLCGAEMENYTEEIPALGHGYSEGWEYVQSDNDVHQVWCMDCYGYTYDEGHDYVNHVCSKCEWTELMSVQFYNGNTLWTETTVPYGEILGIAGMPVPGAPTGYSFAGWYTEDGEWIVHGMTVTEDIVAYAKFDVNTYNITFRVNGATSNVVPVTYGTQITQQWLMSHGVCNLAGYSLRGWTVTYSIKQTPNNYNFSMPAQDFYADAILEINTYTVTWIAGGVTTTETYEYGAAPSFKGSTDKASDGCTDYTFTGWDKEFAPVTENVTYTAQYSQSKSHEWDDATCTAPKTCSVCGVTEGDALGHGHTEGFDYIDLENGNHSVTCKDCGTVTNGSEAHDYSYDAQKHECECGAVETFNVSIYWNGELWVNGDVYKYGTGVMFGALRTPEGHTFVGYAESEGGDVVVAPDGVYTVTKDVTLYAVFEKNTYELIVYDLDGSALLDTYVPYGANVYDYVKDMVGSSVYVETADQIGYNVFAGWVDMDMNPIVDGYTMPADILRVIGDMTYTGWIKYGHIDGWVYEVENQIQKSGWTEIDGSWYYLDSETGIRAEGISRVPYPTVAINGITYGPNAEDVSYEGDSFIDKETGLFYFDENGKFQLDYTGRLGNAYAVNGYLPWHVGLVEINGEYYYFKGDEVNGGNIMVSGDYYVSRNNTTFNMVVGGIYTFDNDGVMQLFHGITESELFEGKRFYIGGQLMVGAGLQDIYTAATGITNYFYVNSYGELVVDAEYYIGANSFGLAKGIYYFDAEGFLVIPEPEVGKSGLFFEEGKWYYYVDGAKAYCAGLIEIDGNWVYVKSDGSLATGMYYVTNVNGHETIASGTKCLFDENGVMQEALNGIIDGVYYVNNSIAYAAGLVETEDGYIYVKSNGQIVTNTQYWITNVNDTGVEPGYYQFDENGIMAPAFTGVKDGCYYENGAIAYAAGLVEIEPGKYVYVRSNGEVATGKYWITNHNGLLPEGFYDFGEDGYLTVN